MGEIGSGTGSAGRDDGRMQRPPERIDVAAAGIVLRRHRADDVDALHDVIAASREHLRPFMPWADQERAATAEFIARTIASWDAGEDFGYLVVEPTADGERLLGACGMHRRGGPDTIEIGYWLRPDAVGRGVMTATARAVTEVAFHLDGVSRVEIRCDTANERSAAIPRRLGFRHVGHVDTEVLAPGQTGRHLVFVTDDPAAVSAAPGAA
jgi:RimJ/RimL family protein N-acetyltransferase